MVEEVRGDVVWAGYGVEEHSPPSIDREEQGICANCGGVRIRVRLGLEPWPGSALAGGPNGDWVSGQALWPVDPLAVLIILL